MENNFDEFEKPAPVNRRDLLPWWIKFFCWVFMIMAVIAGFTPIQLLFGQVPDLSLYGLDAANYFPFEMIVLYIVFFLNGLTGYLLWFKKDRAIDCGKLCAFIGIVVCIGSFIMHGVVSNSFTLRLEIIPLVILYRKLSDIEYNWS